MLLRLLAGVCRILSSAAFCLQLYLLAACGAFLVLKKLQLSASRIGALYKQTVTAVVTSGSYESHPSAVWTWDPKRSAAA